MCSRLFFACLMVLTVGCAKENASKDRVIKVELKGTGTCIENFGKELSSYVSGKMTEPQVVAFWDCVAFSVNEFERVTAGDRGTDDYSPEAIRDFLNTYFFKGSGLDLPLMNAILDLKRVLVGGNSQTLTRAELTKLRGVVAVAKQTFLELHPHRDVIFGFKRNASDADISAATASVRRALDLVGQLLRKEGQSLSYDQISNLLGRLNQWLQADGSKPGAFSKIVGQARVLPQLKQLLIAGDRRGFTGPEWPRLTDTLGRLFGVYLAFTRGFENNLNEGLNRPVLAEAVSLIADQLLQSVSAHDGRVIGWEEWSEFFHKVETYKVLPPVFTAVAMSDVVKWAVVRMLGDGVTVPAGMELRHVERLRERVQGWQKLFQGTPGRSRDWVEKFEPLLATTPSMQWDARHRLMFNSRPPQQWSARDRQQLVLPFVLLNWVKEAYVGSSVDVFTLRDMDTAFGEILPLLQNFGWWRDADLKMGQRRFREANLFTVASNGNEVLELSEAVRYMAYITSAYISAQRWLEVSAPTCGADLPADCVRRIVLDLGTDVLTPFPRLRIAVERWGATRFLSFVVNAETIILGRPASGEYKVGDLLQVWQLMEYVESFMQRFDVDGDDAILLSEAFRAFPVYSLTLKNFANAGADAPDEPFLAFFTFLLKYGEMPNEMFGGMIALEHWKNHRGSWELSVERDRLMQILASLSQI